MTQPKPKRTWYPADYSPTRQWVYGEADGPSFKNVAAVVDLQDDGRWHWRLTGAPAQGIEPGADIAMSAAFVALKEIEPNAILVGGPVSGLPLPLDLQSDWFSMTSRHPVDGEVFRYENTYQDNPDGLRVFRFIEGPQP